MQQRAAGLLLQPAALKEEAQAQAQAMLKGPKNHTLLPIKTPTVFWPSLYEECWPPARAASCAVHTGALCTDRYSGDIV